MLSLRQQVPSKIAMTTAKNISKHLFRYIMGQGWDTIALYRAFRSEISLLPLANALLKEGKHVYYPLMKKENTLSWVETNTFTSFLPNSYGIEEPIERGSVAKPHELQLIIAPLLAFDSFGNRLGYGKGYYDKALSTSKPHRYIGVAYPFQAVTFIPASPHDILLDDIVTSQGFYPMI